MHKKLFFLLGLHFILFCLHPHFSYAQKSFKWATVKKGEGINALLLRNHLSPNEYYTVFLKLNKGRLNKNSQIIAGKRYKIPLKYPIHNFPIFGKSSSAVQQVDNKLGGTLFFLVSGHGGPDPGATGTLSGHTLTEDEYAYDIVLRLARQLLSHGARVEVIIRDKNDGIRDSKFLKPDTDEICYPNQKIPTRQTPRLHQRAAAVNILSSKHSSIKHQRLLMVHLDSRNSKASADVFFLHHSASKAGKALAKTLQSTIREKYAHYQPNRRYSGKVATRRLYMLQTTTPPSTFLELGNIHNRRDQRRFLLASNRETLAQWICEGLIRDFNNNRTKR